jgi:hypothetical protein
MSQKPVVIKLAWHAGVAGGLPEYVVKKVVNTTEFRPGIIMTKAQVDALVARRNWRVETE